MALSTVSVLLCCPNTDGNGSNRSLKKGQVRKWSVVFELLGVKSVGVSMESTNIH